MRFSHLLAAVVATFALSTVTAKSADWTGFYAGVMGGFSSVNNSECSDCTVGATNIAKVVGYNWDSGSTVFGIEEWVVSSVVSEWSEDPANYTKLTWQKLARFGWEIGDSALLYAAAGGGLQMFWFEGGYEGAALFGAVAGGAEFLVSDQISLRGHVQLSYAPDVEGVAYTATSIAAGVIFHFN